MKTSPGRPKASNPKKIVISLRCTPQEALHIKSLAEMHQLSVAEFCRLTVMDRKLPEPLRPVPCINEEAVVELNRIGTNLNQITKKINIGLTVADRQLDDDINDLRQICLLIAQGLLGQLQAHGES